ncbi:MAG: hypothetical protein MUO72_17585 [Bacteroidales bacterium]|nr:hypothetical protein [Bacteroidales bacterium]
MMCNKTYTNRSGRKILKYYPPDSIMLDLDFILTGNKILIIGYPYLKIENWLTDKPTAVRLLDVWDEDNVLYLKIQDLKTSKIDTISHNLRVSSCEVEQRSAFLS